jgi:Nitrogen regulatory protein PII
MGMTGRTETIRGDGKLALVIVPRGVGERVVAIAKQAGARGGTIALGRGTAEKALLALLGIGDTDQDIVFILAANEVAGHIIEALRARAGQERIDRGIVMLLAVPDIVKRVMGDGEAERIPSRQGRDTMRTQAEHKLITLIVNRGYADDAMIAARKAGATGGTVLNARGTGKEEDVKFFGITLVPEKEILLILAEEAKADAILEAIRNLPCLSEPGSGIAYSIEVEEFCTLGKKR